MSRAKRRADCHPEREHRARGLCEACYFRWKKENLPGYKEKQQIKVNAYLKTYRTPAYRKAADCRLNPTELKQLEERAQGRCEICGKVMKEYVVDHCHVTSRIRGLLCRSCNTGLGLFKDSPEVLAAAIEYVTTKAEATTVLLTPKR